MMEQTEVYDRIDSHFRNTYVANVKRFSRYIKDWHRAEDIVSEGFTRACLYWKTCPEDAEAFPRWFNAILNNTSKDNHRTEARRGMVDHKNIEETVQAPVVPMVIVKEVGELIDTKETKEKVILRLIFIEQYKLKDVAELSGMSVSAVKQMSFRFRKEVREKFKWSI